VSRRELMFASFFCYYSSPLSVILSAHNYIFSIQSTE
jgi:hypothetical protein